MATRREMVRRLFELDELAQGLPGSPQEWDALMREVEDIQSWIDVEYGVDTCERLSWYCTSGRFALEDLFRWVDEDWEDLNKFLLGDSRSETY